MPTRRLMKTGRRKGCGWAVCPMPPRFTARFPPPWEAGTARLAVEARASPAAPGGPGRLSAVERPTRLAVLDEPRGRLEASAEARLQALDLLQEGPRPHGVGPAEGAAQEGREAQAEDGAHVAVAGAAQDAFAQAADGLVHHLQGDPLRDLGPVEGLAGASAGDQVVDRRVDLLLLAVVGVEALPALAAEPAGLHHLPERFGRAHALAEGLVHHFGDLGGHVD